MLFRGSYYRSVKDGLEKSEISLCDPMDCSLPGFSIHGTFQARVLEWGANAFSGTLSLELPFSLDHNIFIFYLKQSINSFGMKPIFITFIMF